MRQYGKTKAVFAITLILMLLAVSLTSVSLSAPAAEPPKGPYLDEWWWVTIPDSAARIMKLRTGEIDMTDVTSPDDYATLVREGFNVASAPRTDIVNFQLNLKRDVIKDVNFRRALAHLVPKERLTAQLFGPLAEASDSMMPSSYGKWHNPDVPEYDYDPQLAIETLINAGYTPVLKSGESTPEPGTIDHWIDPMTGQSLKTLDFVYHTANVEYIEYDDAWALEMEDIGLKINRVPMDYEPWIYRVVLDRDYDISGAEWFGWASATPDYLYLFWHSAMDVEWGLNFEAFHNDTFDHYCDIIMTSLDEAEVTAASYKCQEILADQLPNIPLYMPYNVFACKPGLAGFEVTTMLEYGNRMKMQWNTAGAVLRIGVAAEQDTLSPATWLTYTGRSRIFFDNLVERNPYDGKWIPWIAQSWTMEPWSDSGRGVGSGTKMTFSLRNDVYWHDGVQFTANDVIFSLDYAKHYEIPFLMSAWQYLVDTEVVDPLHVNVYLNTTGLWNLIYISSTAVYFAKHIWNPSAALFGEPEGLIGIQVEGQPGVPTPIGEGAFRPWEVPYPGRETELTCAIGVGQWILPSNGWKKGEYMRTLANHNYFRRVLNSDVNCDFVVNIIDISTAARAFGTKVGAQRYKPGADMNGDMQINIVDLARIARDFGKTW
jgi:ABC-type transport system substrate-binding protein